MALLNLTYVNLAITPSRPNEALNTVKNLLSDHDAELDASDRYVRSHSPVSSNFALCVCVCVCVVLCCVCKCAVVCICGCSRRERKRERVCARVCMSLVCISAA
jgi:hypothetical protein